MSSVCKRVPTLSSHILPPHFFKIKVWAKDLHACRLPPPPPLWHHHHLLPLHASLHHHQVHHHHPDQKKYYNDSNQRSGRGLLNSTLCKWLRPCAWNGFPFLTYALSWSGYETAYHRIYSNNFLWTVWPKLLDYKSGGRHLFYPRQLPPRVFLVISIQNKITSIGCSWNILNYCLRYLWNIHCECGDCWMQGFGHPDRPFACAPVASLGQASGEKHTSYLSFLLHIFWLNLSPHKSA